MRSGAGILLIALLLASCGGGADSGSVTPAPDPPPLTGTGTLTLKVTSADAYPLADALVRVTVQNGAVVARGQTASDGTVTFQSLPPRVHISVSHEFGKSLRQLADVSQTSPTSISLAMTPYRPQPVAALLPVEIPAGGVSADRSQVRLRFRLVASRSTPFVVIDYGWPLAAPYLGINFTHDDYYARRDCHLYVTRDNVAPVCDSWGERRSYEVDAEALWHDNTGTIPIPPAPGAARSTMLVIDQSRRFAAFDPHGYRSFAARNLIERLLDDDLAGNTLSIAGMAGDDGASPPRALAQRPLWLPRGTGTVFSADHGTLTSDVSILEPLMGGSAPLFEALGSAMSTTADHASSGTRTIVALVGAVDDSPAPPTAREAALTNLREQQNATGIRVIFVAALQDMAFEDRDRLAELAEALHAPVLSPGAVAGGSAYPTQTSAPGIYAALDLAADLIEGERLPTLSATVLVKAGTPNSFPAGSTLRGVVFLQSNQCPFDCTEVPLEFAVKVP